MLNELQSDLVKFASSGSHSAAFSFCRERDTRTRLLRSSKSFGIRSSETPEILHNFSANNFLRIRTYRACFRKSFRMRTYKKGGRGRQWSNFQTQFQVEGYPVPHLQRPNTIQKSKPPATPSPFNAVYPHSMHRNTIQRKVWSRKANSGRLDAESIWGLRALFCLWVHLRPERTSNKR